jgi:hypothetical protein
VFDECEGLGYGVQSAVPGAGRDDGVGEGAVSGSVSEYAVSGGGGGGETGKCFAGLGVAVRGPFHMVHFPQL